MQTLGPDAKVTREAQREAIERAEGRADYYVIWNMTNLSGARGEESAAELRDALLSRGIKDIQVVRVVEDYAA